MNSDPQNPEPGTRNPEPGTPNPEPGTLNPEPGLLEILDAFVDGRRVNAPDLKRALAEEEGRNYFVDAWLLRESLQDEMAAEIVPPAGPAASPGSRWILPVAVSLICLVGGSFAGYRLAQSVDSRVPPIAAPVSPPATPAPAAQPSFPVPAPTRAIPIEFSADKGSFGGGN
jgi:hypothetical protein